MQFILTRLCNGCPVPCNPVFLNRVAFGTQTLQNLQTSREEILFDTQYAETNEE